VTAVIITVAAERDLEEIADFISRDNPRRAIAFITELRDRCHKIATFPEAAPLRPDLGENVRVVTCRGYLLIYWTRPELVFVLRIVHGARNLPDLL
jgi:toxin ParE1/3/4